MGACRMPCGTSMGQGPHVASHNDILLFSLFLDDLMATPFFFSFFIASGIPQRRFFTFVLEWWD